MLKTATPSLLMTTPGKNMTISIKLMPMYSKLMTMPVKLMFMYSKLMTISHNSMTKSN